jgi:hypothetical protein
MLSQSTRYLRTGENPTTNDKVTMRPQFIRERLLTEQYLRRKLLLIRANPRCGFLRLFPMFARA